MKIQEIMARATSFSHQNRNLMQAKINHTNSGESISFNNEYLQTVISKKIEISKNSYINNLSQPILIKFRPPEKSSGFNFHNYASPSRVTILGSNSQTITSRPPVTNQIHIYQKRQKIAAAQNLNLKPVNHYHSKVPVSQFNNTNEAIFKKVSFSKLKRPSVETLNTRNSTSGFKDTAFKTAEIILPTVVEGSFYSRVLQTGKSKDITHNHYSAYTIPKARKSESR